MRSDVADRAVDDPTTAMFASSTVAEHVLRGVIGLVLVVLSLTFAASQPWALLGLVPAAIAWRGCPTCWAMGLAATISRGRTSGCDGSC
jgi:hypothetical protein